MSEELEFKKEWREKIVKGIDFKDSDLRPISTSSTKLDWALKLPFLEGSIVEVYGPNQTGKTTLALEVCGNAMSMGKKTFYMDLERKLREAQLNMIDGFDRDGFTLVYPDTGEEAVNMMHEIILSSPGCVIVLDSVGALLPEVEDAQGAENQTMGLVARLTAKLIRKVTGIAARNKCTLIFINHLTATMAMFGKKMTVKGGKAIQDRAAQRIEMFAPSAGKIKDGNGDIIGQMVRCKVEKNNVNRPYITVEVPIIFGKGIASALDMLQFAKDLGILPYQKGWYTVPIDGEDKRMREAQVLEMINEDEDFKSSVQDKIDELFG